MTSLDGETYSFATAGHHLGNDTTNPMLSGPTAWANLYTEAFLQFLLARDARPRLLDFEPEDVPSLVPVDQQLALLKPINKLQNPSSLTMLAMAAVMTHHQDKVKQLPAELQDLTTLIPKCQHCQRHQVNRGPCSADLGFKLQIHRPNARDENHPKAWITYIKCQQCSDCQLCEALAVGQKETKKNDIELVMSQTNCCWHQAVQALKNHDNDIVEAIIELTVN